MSEQEMLINLVCHGNLKALRQTKNLNLKVLTSSFMYSLPFERDIWDWLGLSVAC